MGIWLHAHFGIGLKTSGAERMAYDLQTECPHLTRYLREWLIPRQKDRFPNSSQAWQVWTEDKSEDGLFALDVPACSAVLRVYGQRAELYAGTKWWVLYDDAQFQHLFRQACFDIAQLLSSPAAIYVPETILIKGETIEDITAHLLREHGTPPTSIDALRQYDENSDLYGPFPYYYVDRFHDLSRGAPSPPSA